MGCPWLVCIVALDFALNATRTTWCTQVTTVFGFGACSTGPTKSPPHGVMGKGIVANEVGGGEIILFGFPKRWITSMKSLIAQTNWAASEVR